MGKAASTKNVVRAHIAGQQNPTWDGPKLGILVYRGRVPASAVATLLRVSLPTAYRWFYGINDVAPEFGRRVRKLIVMLEDALENYELPAVGTFEERVATLVSVVSSRLEIKRK